MILVNSTATVSTAGTEVQLSNTNRKVRWIKVKALAGNSNKVYLGIAGSISSSLGYELSAGNELEINFAELGGTIVFSTLWADAATNGDKLAWVAVLDG